MKNDVFINRLSPYLPNNPVNNDEMEDYLGLIEGKASRVKRIVLRQNGINTRYYALNKKQEITHTNAELAANAIKGLFKSEAELGTVELLSTATSIPDQVLPSHASMVHGLLKSSDNMELFATAGVCLTSLQALKIAYQAIAVGDKNNAVCCASELVSATLLSKHYDMEYEKCHSAGENPYFGFEKDFLRFMLSDGACALLLERTPNVDCLSLKIEWVEMASYANRLPTCMLLGGNFTDNGEVTGWKSFESLELAEKSIFVVKQDIRLLKEYVVKYWVDHIELMLSKHVVKTSEVRYVIPHVSSMFFYYELLKELELRNIDLGEDKWFTNLTWVGNMGSASIFVALEELMRTKPLRKGDEILLLVPESGRFSYGTALLKVV